MNTFVYVDGFNLYYGCLKGTPYRWLDLPKFIRQHLKPENKVMRVKLFTAKVKPLPSDPQQLNRQLLYWRALRTLPEMEIIEGQFLSRPTRMPLHPRPSQGPRSARVMKTEEKGSDVNLATHLLCDAYEKQFGAAVVVTNDSDLVEPIRMVQQRIKLRVVVINPHPRKPAYELGRYARKIIQAEESLRPSCVFPVTMKDKDGDFNRPAEWVCSCCKQDTTGNWASDCQCFCAANPKCKCSSRKCLKHCGCGASSRP